MRDAIPAIHALGAEVHVIGSGAPHFIAGFRETTGYPGPVLTDPSLAAFQAAALRRGLATVMSVGSVVRTVGALRRGFRQGATQGDALQQGGALVIARDGRIVYHHISSGPGDHVPRGAIERALSSLGAGAPVRA